MHFDAENVYHVYNRGNNKIKIFFSDANYRFFLQKAQYEWCKYCNIFSYTLMPNHFHFMLQPNMTGCNNIPLNGKASDIQVLSKVIGKSLSAYTQAINIQNNTTGNLFQKKTKAKCLTEKIAVHDDLKLNEYLVNCFHYIHSNPIEAGMVKELKDWPYSSWHEYYGSCKKGICNKELALEWAGSSIMDFERSVDFIFNKEILQKIW